MLDSDQKVASNGGVKTLPKPASLDDSLPVVSANGNGFPVAEKLPDHGVPARFTVHLVDVPDAAASYEFYSVGLLQRPRATDKVTSG